MKKKAKNSKQIYDDLIKLPDLKSKINFIVKTITRKSFKDEVILNEIFKAIVDYLQISYPFLQSFPELLKGSNRNRMRRFIKDVVIAQAIKELFENMIKMKIEDTLIKDKILKRDKNGDLVGTPLFLKNRIEPDLDKIFDELKKNKLKLFIKLMTANEALISQILIILAEYIDEEQHSYYTEFMFLENYIQHNGYQEYLKHIDEMEQLFQENVIPTFINSTSYELYNKFKEKYKVTFLEDVYDTDSVKKVKKSISKELMNVFLDEHIRLTFIEKDRLDSIVKKMQKRLYTVWRKNAKEIKK